MMPASLSWSSGPRGYPCHTATCNKQSNGKASTDHPDVVILCILVSPVCTKEVTSAAEPTYGLARVGCSRAHSGCPLSARSRPMSLATRWYSGELEPASIPAAHAHAKGWRGARQRAGCRE